VHRAAPHPCGSGPLTPLRVAQLWRYPVKSMAGESVPRLRFGRHGVVGDRAFALVSADTGRVLTARRVPELLGASARWFGCEAEIRLPDGSRFRSSDPAASDLLSDWLGRAVRLARPAGRALTVEQYAGDGEAAPSTDFDLPQWGFVDDAPVHILGEGSLRAAEQWYPQGDWSLPRFRPNVLVTGPEDALLGPRLAAGGAVLEPTGPCKRCVMVTQPQRGLGKDREILRTLIARADASLGVYAGIVRPGSVTVNDTLDPLLTAASAQPAGRV
jgi:uncharacterized protein YcbX